VDSVPDVRAQTEAPRGDAIADWRAAAAAEVDDQLRTAYRERRRAEIEAGWGLLDGP
jgi:hypothetical protein